MAYTARRFDFCALPMLIRAALTLVFCSAAAAHAGVLYKCNDDGRVTYTNNKGSYRSCVVVSRDGPAVAAPAPAAASRPRLAVASPADFPKVSSETQKARDTDRQHILEQELASEQKNLDEARRGLAEQEAARAPVDRQQPYKDRIALHSRNLDALRRELGKLK